MNWRGRPLTSYRTIVELISATTTETGLTIRAELDTEFYPKGVASPTPNWMPFRSPDMTGTGTGTTPSSRARMPNQLSGES
jgi:hypothetical protein